MTTWTLQDIPWHRFDPGRVDATVLTLAKSASLVESNSDDYGRYLRQVFAGDASWCAVIERWAAEEVQHGLALRRWCELADPSFDFAQAFERFTAKIRLPDGSAGSVRGSRTGELLARCVVECGTSTYYRSLCDRAQEPVLRSICTRIARDEFSHYRLFLDQSRRWMQREPISLLTRLQVVLGRMLEGEDDELAYAWHCSLACAPEYRRRPVLGEYLVASLSVLRQEHLERGLGMAFRAAGISSSRRIMGMAGTLAMRLVRLRIRSLASAAPKARVRAGGRVRPPWPRVLTA